MAPYREGFGVLRWCYARATATDSGDNRCMSDLQRKNSDPVSNPADHLARYRWRKRDPSPNPSGRAPRKRFIEELATVLAEPLVEGDLSSPTKMHAVASKPLELCLTGNVQALAIFLPHVDPQLDFCRFFASRGGTPRVRQRAA